jgi:(p)ppGpp synthase/HD superfamily hydrolase
LIGAFDTTELIHRLPQTAEAVGFARDKHAGQVRQADGAPFIQHPLEVAVLLYQDGARDEVIAAGALHDVLEKTDATAYELSVRFGRRIGEIVRAMTEDPTVAGYARRKAALREQVAAAGTDALTVFAADKLSKVREQRLCAGDVTPMRRRKVKHYRHCLALLQERLPGEPLVREFQRELEGLLASTPALTPAG